MKQGGSRPWIPTWRRSSREKAMPYTQKTKDNQTPLYAIIITHMIFRLGKATDCEICYSRAHQLTLGHILCEVKSVVALQVAINEFFWKLITSLLCSNISVSWGRWHIKRVLSEMLLRAHILVSCQHLPTYILKATHITGLGLITWPLLWFSLRSPQTGTWKKNTHKCCVKVLSLREAKLWFILFLLTNKRQWSPSGEVMGLQMTLERGASALLKGWLSPKNPVQPSSPHLKLEQLPLFSASEAWYVGHFQSIKVQRPGESSASTRQLLLLTSETEVKHGSKRLYIGFHPRATNHSRTTLPSHRHFLCFWLC